MNSFYQPLAATSFLTLRTNTQMFKPPHDAFRRPVQMSDGRIASRLPLQIQPDMSPEIPEAIAQLLLGRRGTEDSQKHNLHKGSADTWNPASGRGLVKNDPQASHRMASTYSKELMMV